MPVPPHCTGESGFSCRLWENLNGCEPNTRRVLSIQLSATGMLSQLMPTSLPMTQSYRWSLMFATSCVLRSAEAMIGRRWKFWKTRHACPSALFVGKGSPKNTCLSFHKNVANSPKPVCSREGGQTWAVGCEACGSLVGCGVVWVRVCWGVGCLGLGPNGGRACFR